jgi:hypothetical protein
VPRERSHGLVARREQNPAVESESASRLEDGLDGLLLIAQVRDAARMRGVARQVRDRPFVVDDARWDRAASEAADDAEPLIVAADDDRSDARRRLVQRGRATGQDG